MVDAASSPPAADGPTLHDVYADRNRLVLLAAAMAREAGYEVGLITDPDEPDWPVVAVALPTGQVSWHVPRALVAPIQGRVPNPEEWPVTTWDGHSNEQKAERIMAWCGPTVPPAQDGEG